MIFCAQIGLLSEADRVHYYNQFSSSQFQNGKQRYNTHKVFSRHALFQHQGADETALLLRCNSAVNLRRGKWQGGI
jgi:hypothetical protein